jgi:hypothetical protein
VNHAPISTHTVAWIATASLQITLSITATVIIYASVAMKVAMTPAPAAMKWFPAIAPHTTREMAKCIAATVRMMK